MIESGLEEGDVVPFSRPLDGKAPLAIEGESREAAEEPTAAEPV